MYYSHWNTPSETVGMLQKQLKEVNESFENYKRRVKKNLMRFPTEDEYFEYLREESSQEESGE